MKKFLIFIIFIVSCINYIYSNDMKYPFIYIPGMFDNGDMITPDSLMVKNVNDKGGYYDKNYYNDSKYVYDKERMKIIPLLIILQSIRF